MLSRSGTCAAIAVGTLTTWRGGYLQATLMIAFFGASNVLSRMGSRRKRSMTDFAAKSSRRDAVQVLANGGVSTVIATIWSGYERDPAYVAALAAATGDTWATEIGGMSMRRPRHILTFEPVPPGTSGGVTIAGLLGSAAGGAFIGLIAEAGKLGKAKGGQPRALALTAGLCAGIGGSLIDSLLGATLQERRWCPYCNASTERDIHTCGIPTEFSGGVPGVDNDVVNLFSTGFGALIGLTISRLFYQRKREA
jgi:uncharacterized protein (TIGR00297 family)